MTTPSTTLTEAQLAEAQAARTRPCRSCKGTGLVKSAFSSSICGRCRGAKHDAIIREGIQWVGRLGS